jgi:ubiquinone/menaquinone biosynthesis C-methylase UbiE
MESHVKDHYNTHDLPLKIQDALEKAGKDINNLTLKDLASVDQLHTGGAPATISLFKKAGFSKDAVILDAGCGIGGSSRLLAEKFKCRVMGIDLAPGFVETAKVITQWYKLDPSICYEQGSILDLPFEDASFDGVLCQHILMNIQDKEKALKEFYRVLKPGGKLILHEIFKGEGDHIALPVPWAGDASISFLEPWEDFEPWLVNAGFILDSLSNESKQSLEWWQMVNAINKKKNSRPLGSLLVFGENAVFFGPNMEKNFKNNSIQCIEAVFKKS